MIEIKYLCLRLPGEEYKAFAAICRERGYSKTGKIRELIRAMIKAEIKEAVVSAAEWARIASGLREIEKGESVSFGDLKQRIRKSALDHRQGRKIRKPEDRKP